MTLYIKKILKTLPKKKLELINEFGKVAEYKINVQKSVVLLSTNSTLAEREIKITILFTIVSKYRDINFIKEVKDLCFT